jgi:hypothetical protein
MTARTFRAALFSRGTDVMISMVALYRGETLQTASLIAVSTDLQLVAQVAASLLREQAHDIPEDPAVSAARSGRRQALRLVYREAKRERSAVNTPIGKPGP